MLGCHFKLMINPGLVALGHKEKGVSTLQRVEVWYETVLQRSWCSLATRVASVREVTPSLP
jgi:hypothetical protein